MNKFLISEEVRHFVDAILHSFCYPRRINDIRGEIKRVLKKEKGDASETNLMRIYFLVIHFLTEQKFGHGEDYVYLIDKKGMDLKEAGSLKAFEERYLNPPAPWN